MTPRPSQPHDMELVGIISHNGTKDNGHYTAITRRDDKWTLYNDAIVTQITTSHIHQTQAYILMYRKIEPSVEIREPAPKDVPKKQDSQLRVKGDLNPRPGKKQNREIPAPQPDFLIQPTSGQNLPRQVRRDSGTNSAPRVELPKEIQGVPDTTLNAHVTTPPDPEPEAKSGKDGRGWMEGNRENATSTMRDDEKERPLQPEEQSRQPLEETTTLLQFISTFFQLSQGRIEDLTGLLSELSGTPITTEMTCTWLDLEPQTKEILYVSRTKDLFEGLTEDPEDNPAGFITSIELHIARLKKAHLLYAETSATIQKKWEEGTDLTYIGKFLQTWAPEHYRDKPMPRGMIQALLGTAPNSQDLAPADLSDCMFRNTEAMDTVEDLARSLNSQGTSGSSTA